MASNISVCAQKRIEAPGERIKRLLKFSLCTVGQTPVSPISKVMEDRPLEQGQTQAPLQSLPCCTCLGLTASQHLTEHQETFCHHQQLFITPGVNRVQVRPLSDITVPGMECFKHGFVLVPFRDVGASLETDPADVKMIFFSFLP